MDTTINESNCDKEPVAFINQIQPFGAMIVVDEHMNIAQVSANIERWLGEPAEDVVGKPVSEYFGIRQMEAVTAFASSQNSRALIPIRVLGKHSHHKANAIAHNSIDGYLVLELEPRDEDADASSADLASAGLKECIDSISATETLDSFVQTLAKCVHKLTDFDRVMIYRFHEDWHGEVVAEAKVPEVEVESYMGNHFPASDIPEPARKLFAATWTRVIADVNLDPVSMQPVYADGRGRPINLTLSSLRQASPIHIEYLKNMNVRSSLTISLLLNGRLWGLVACHHRKPKYLNYWMRSTCEFIGKFASEHLKGIVTAESKELLSRFSSLGLKIVDDPKKQNMEQICREAAQLFHASHVLFVPDEGKIFGSRNSVPDEGLLALHKWLREVKKSNLFFSNRLSDNVEYFKTHQKSASGLIAVRMLSGYLMIFRPEYLQTLTFAGNPEKAFELGLERLHPRVSFEAWKHEVKGQSKRWSDAEVICAQSLASLFDATSTPVEEGEDWALTPSIRNSLMQSIKLIDELTDDEMVSHVLSLKLKTMRSRFSEVLNFLDKA